MTNSTASSNWPHIIALVSVISASLTPVLSTWSNNNANLELEKLKSELNQQKIKYEHDLKSKKDRCQNITQAAFNLAKAASETYKNFDLEKRSEIDAQLWSAATLLPKEDKTSFIYFYNQGPKKDDEHGIMLDEQLIAIALKGLANEAERCH